ncbi:MAG: type II toxin-antitoxin system VapC family toxin [Blastocatellia bacterium]
MPIASPAVVADTHTLIWFLINPARLSGAALAVLQAAEAASEPIYVATITIVELRYLVEKRTITEADFQFCLTTLKDPTTAPTAAMLDLAAAEMLAQIPRAVVPDMPDRIIAATALSLGLPLVTADAGIRKLTNITTIW